jgi:predicted transcriptional regulator
MSEIRPTDATAIHTTEAWQVQCIEDGLAAAREGRVRPADVVFAEIAAKHGWACGLPPA